MKIPFFKLFFIAFTLGVFPSQGQLPASGSFAAVSAPSSDISDLTLDQTLALPQVPEKLKPAIKEYMLREARALQKMGYEVETMRHGEIVIATISASELFAPNDTSLMSSASKKLANFIPYFRVPGRFKVILAMHSDDTGSEDYLEHLTQARILALYDYFDNHISNSQLLVGYPLGGSDPLVANDSRSLRAKNRRLEIYLMPGPALIEEQRLRR